MANYALLTASGKDCPGIVAAITGVLFEGNCNIEDSQMARLGPEFVCMLMIRMPEEMTSEQLADRLNPVAEQFGLRLYVMDLGPKEASEIRSEKPKHLIHVYGADKKGIVHRISSCLADNQVNITNLHTEVIYHESPLYVMMIEVEILPDVDAARLRKTLEAIGKEIDVVVSMKPKDDARF